jgi:hypothetical protein
MTERRVTGGTVSACAYRRALIGRQKDRQADKNTHERQKALTGSVRALSEHGIYDPNAKTAINDVARFREEKNGQSLPSDPEPL